MLVPSEPTISSNTPRYRRKICTRLSGPSSIALEKEFKAKTTKRRSIAPRTVLHVSNWEIHDGHPALRRKNIDRTPVLLCERTPEDSPSIFLHLPTGYASLKHEPDDTPQSDDGKSSCQSPHKPPDPQRGSRLEPTLQTYNHNSGRPSPRSPTVPSKYDTRISVQIWR